jgi:chromosome segregation ATPase
LSKRDARSERQQILAAAGFTGDMTRAEILKRAFDDLGWLSGRLIGLVLLKGALGEAASLEALCEAAQARRDALQAKADELEALIAAREIEAQEAQRRIKAWFGELDAHGAARLAEAEGHVESARAAAAAIVSQAESLVPGAREEAERIIGMAETRAAAIVGDTHARLADVTAQIAAGERACAAIDERRAALEAAMNRLREQIDLLRKGL